MKHGIQDGVQPEWFIDLKNEISDGIDGDLRARWVEEIDRRAASANLDEYRERFSFFIFRTCVEAFLPQESISIYLIDLKNATDAVFCFCDPVGAFKKAASFLSAEAFKRNRNATYSSALKAGTSDQLPGNFEKSWSDSLEIARTAAAATRSGFYNKCAGEMVLMFGVWGTDWEKN